MAINKARFKTKICDGKNFIETKDQVLKVKKGIHKLKFVNKLKDSAGFVEAKVKFFELADKNGVEIEEFCDGASGAVLTLAADSTTQCKPNYLGDFEYSVTATNHEPLDPVIIIEPQHHFFSVAPVMPDVGPAGVGPFGGGAVFAMAASLFLGGLLGIFVGRRMRG